MILNLRVDHKIADIQSMENISKDIDDLFWKLQEKYSVNEYVEISTCNRKEYYIKNDYKRFFNDPMVVLNEVRTKVSDRTFIEIMSLYDRYKDKIK